jgi:hypothetical protein
MAAWLVEQEAEEVVMESTAQYWKPCGKHWSDYRPRCWSGIVNGLPSPTYCHFLRFVKILAPMPDV